MQSPLQQSVLPTQAAVAGAHVAIEDAHVPATVLQMPEQQLLPSLHVPPYAVQLTLTPLAPLVPELPEVPVAPAVPVVPELPNAPEVPVAPELPVVPPAASFPAPDAPSSADASAFGPEAFGESTPHASGAVLATKSTPQMTRLIMNASPIERHTLPNGHTRT